MGLMKDAAEKFREMAAETWNKVPKFGQGSMKAQLLAGFEEIRNALYPESNVEPGDPGGRVGNENRDRNHGGSRSDAGAVEGQGPRVLRPRPGRPGTGRPRTGDRRLRGR